MINELLHKRLIFVTGKGGVGKSTLVACLALLIHQQTERRVLACEAGPCSALGPLLGLGAPLGHAPVRSPSGLAASNVDPDRALMGITQRFLRSPTIARATVSNPFTQLFFKTAPFVSELATLLHLRQLLHPTEGDWDTVVFDLPSTGHATSFLTAPSTAHGLLRVGGLAQLTQRLDEALRDPEHTSIVLVTRPEPLPILESVTLHAQLTQALGPTLHHVFINMVHPNPLGDAERDALNRLTARASGDDLPPALTRLIEGGVRGVSQRDQEQRQIARLKAALPSLQQTALPYLFNARSDPDLVTHLTDVLTNALDAQRRAPY